MFSVVALVAALSAANAHQEDNRVLIATIPVAEVRSDTGLFCTTPCVTKRNDLGNKLTISREGESDVFFDPKLPPTPPGGVLDPGQNFNFEVSKQFIFMVLGSTGKDINDTPQPRH